MNGETGKTCDRCGPSTRAQDTFTKGSDVWDFCRHHSQQHGARLLSLGYVRKIRIPVTTR